jgi:predicted RNase H-like HicB family nuclease
MMQALRVFSLSRYVEEALRRAEYERDEDGVVIAHVPDAVGFVSQGGTFEEARENLADAIESAVLVALQLGYPIPTIDGVTIEERDAETLAAEAG